MMQEIQVPYQGFRKGEPFEALEFNGVEKALRECQGKGYEALTMPDLVDTKIAAPRDSYVWRNGFTTLSLKVTGRGKISNVSKKGGTPFVVFYHLPDHHFSDPNNIAEAVNKGLLNGAGVVPQDEFQRYLDMKDNELVFVEDYERLSKPVNIVTTLSKAMEHPQTIPFLGGKDRAEKYLQKQGQFFGDTIDIWSEDDLDVQPRGRVLFLYYAYYGLIGGNNLINNGRFVGVVAPEARAENQQDVAPSLEEVLALGNVHVSEAGRKGFEKAARLLYPKRQR